MSSDRQPFEGKVSIMIRIRFYILVLVAVSAFLIWNDGYKKENKRLAVGLNTKTENGSTSLTAGPEPLADYKIIERKNEIIVKDKHKEIKFDEHGLNGAVVGVGLKVTGEIGAVGVAGDGVGVGVVPQLGQLGVAPGRFGLFV